MKTAVVAEAGGLGTQRPGMPLAVPVASAVARGCEESRRPRHATAAGAGTMARRRGGRGAILPKGTVPWWPPVACRTSWPSLGSRRQSLRDARPCNIKNFLDWIIARTFPSAAVGRDCEYFPATSYLCKIISVGEMICSSADAAVSLFHFKFAIISGKPLMKTFLQHLSPELREEADNGVLPSLPARNHCIRCLLI